MTAQPVSASKSTRKLSWHIGSKSKRLLAYTLIICIPFLATYALDMQDKTLYAAFISMFNTLAMMVFYIQFPLAGRLKHISLFANIDWGMAQHKRMGKWLGIIFFLHPFLFIAPRFMVSVDDGLHSLRDIVTAPQMLTGIIAWVGMIVWVLLAVFKNRLSIPYEKWRFMHMLGFVSIAVLATLHITTVGSHGQFVWLNTSTSGGVKDHPFSIASSRSSLPQLSFVIRNLGDYTAKLNDLQVSQKVYVDGPYGSMSLGDAKGAGAVILIAGGAGIGPMLSLVRGLADAKDNRPIRLIYANNHFDQMVLQDEIHALEASMSNFKQQLVCIEAGEQQAIYEGVIDRTVIEQVMADAPVNDWVIFLCGPKPMIDAGQKHLKAMKVSSRNIHYEQLSF